MPFSSVASLRTSYILNQNCGYNDTINIGVPSTLSTTGRFHGLAKQVKIALEMVVDEINQRCGLQVNDLRYKVNLLVIDDESSTTQTRAAAEVFANVSDFFLGPISSPLTAQIASVAKRAQKLLIAGISAKTAIFSDNYYAYGTLPASSTFLVQGLLSVRNKGTRSVAFWHTDGNPLCNGAVDLAKSLGLTVVAYERLPAMPDLSHLTPVVDRAKANDTDAVVLCPYLSTCIAAFKAMRNANWSPKALIVPICAVDNDFLNEVGTDARYIVGSSPWISSVVSSDSLLGWSAKEFANKFLKLATHAPTYHAASAGAGLSLLLQAIQRAGSTETNATIHEILKGGFETFYGNVSFSSDGLYFADTVAFQRDANDDLLVIGPRNKASGEILYPMPTWAWRDCYFGNNCSMKGQCEPRGSCLCQPGYSPVEDECVVIPVENKNRDGVVTVLAIVLAALALFSSLCCVVWTIVCRGHGVVKASQMKFLVMIAAGCVISTLAIFCIAFEDRMDFEELARTGEYSLGNMACMGAIWTYTIGFTITFAPLFAKMWRVRALLRNTKMLRVTITNWQVLRIVTLLATIDTIIMACWQLDAPWKFFRDVKDVDERGFPVDSVGVCRSEEGKDSTPYLVSLFAFHILILLYGTRLCYQTAGIPTAFSEGKYVSVAIVSHLQLLALGIPLLILVVSDPPSNMLVRSGIIFLNDLSALGLIFLPKLYLWVQNRHDFDVTAVLSLAAHGSTNPSLVKSTLPRPSCSAKVSGRTLVPTEIQSSAQQQATSGG